MKDIDIYADIPDEEIKKNMEKSLVDVTLDSKIKQILYRAENLINFTLAMIIIVLTFVSFAVRNELFELYRFGVISGALLFWFVAIPTIHITRNNVSKLLDKRVVLKAKEKCIFKDKGE